MTRMTREFSLVLLGAGLLTAGYFALPDQDFEKRTEEQARKRVGGTTSRGGMLLFVHTGGGTYTRGSGVRSSAMANVSRGGFSSMGGRMSGGG